MRLQSSAATVQNTLMNSSFISGLELYAILNEGLASWNVLSMKSNPCSLQDEEREAFFYKFLKVQCSSRSPYNVEGSLKPFDGCCLTSETSPKIAGTLKTALH